MTPPKATFAWLDGRIVPWEEATTHLATHALHCGTAVFEGIRCYASDGGVAAFRGKDHLRRLYRSARSLAMEIPFDFSELVNAMNQIVRENAFTDCYIRPLAFRGFGEFTINPLHNPVQVAILAWPQEGSFKAMEQAGIRVGFSSWRRLDWNVIPPEAKITGAYVNACLARIDAVRAGYDEALMLNSTGQVAEATIENVFVGRESVLYTPHLSSGALAGITRDTIITLACDGDVEVVETSMTRADIYSADEVFLTGTAAEIVPVREVDGRGFEAPGPLTAWARTAYREVVLGRNDRHLGWLDRVH